VIVGFIAQGGKGTTGGCEYSKKYLWVCEGENAPPGRILILVPLLIREVIHFLSHSDAGM
jgi:hypothetical protein